MAINDCAQGEIRTRMRGIPLDPEPSVSASFTTWASLKKRKNLF